MSLEKLPDSVLLQIFRHLDLHDLNSISRVSRKFCKISKDSWIWKELLLRDYEPSELPDSFPDWKSEYKTLYSETPSKCVQAVRHHVSEIVHITFSKNGDYLASLSKDKKIALWKCSTKNGSPIRLIGNYYLPDYSLYWYYPCYCQFNDNASMILVAGNLGGTQGHAGIFRAETDQRKISLVTTLFFEPSLHCTHWLGNRNIAVTACNNTGASWSVYNFNALHGTKQRLLTSSYHDISLPYFLTAVPRDQNDSSYLLLCALRLIGPNAPGRNFIIGYNVNTANNLTNFHLLPPTFTVDCNGYIVGMKPSSDHRILTVTAKRWYMDKLGEYNLSTNCDVRMVDLESQVLVPSKMHGSKCHASQKWADSSGDLVACGSVDHKVNIWSIRYGCLIKQLHHPLTSDFALFHPKTNKILVSAGDDCVLRVWKSIC